MSTLLDVSGEKHDMYVVGLQEAPNFSGDKVISEVLGDKYLYVLHPLKFFLFTLPHMFANFFILWKELGSK